MEISWNDDRLSFISLNEDKTKNIIDNFTDIWIPQVGFIDVISPVQDNLEERNEIFTMTKTEEGIPPGSEDLELNYI